jgi:transposase
MKYIIGENREQMVLFASSLDDAISKDNEVRLIDAFVESLPLDQFGFKCDFVENGRPGYRPADLLKLFMYGYLNKTRSSRDLEKECKRNIEVMWLMKRLTPDHNTISNFRRDNTEAIRKVFKSTVSIAKYFNLIGGKLIAGDSTKLRAQNSKKNNYNQKKIDRHLAYIDNKLAEYNAKLAQEDGDKINIEKEIDKHKIRRKKYEDLQKQLNETGELQISTTDPDSRQLITRNNITEVGYNIQSTADADHNIMIDYKTTNENDSKAMGEMTVRASEIVGHTNFTSLYDKGYHTGSELKIAQELGIQAIVAIPDLPSSSHAPDNNFNLDKFTYNKENHSYSCPQGHTLTTNGNWYNKNSGKYITKIQQFKTPECKNCPVKEKCTKSSRDRGRIIERSEYMPYIEQNKINVDNNKELYRRRQAIIEHPFGIIKRQWGFSYILTKKGIKRAEADVGLMFVAFNLRRLINIIGFDRLISYLISFYYNFRTKSSIFSLFKRLKIKIPKLIQQIQQNFYPLKTLYFSPKIQVIRIFC